MKTRSFGAIRRPHKAKTKGFTLIELLVVISIIALLSSVVLVGVSEARNKAKEKAFRAEVMQFITALEMYKNDHGDYLPVVIPTIQAYWSITDSTAGGISNIGSLTEFTTTYFKKIPKPYTENSYLKYITKVKCTGDVNDPPYAIIIKSNQPGFEDWEYANNALYGQGKSSESHCFSLK